MSAEAFPSSSGHPMQGALHEAQLIESIPFAQGQPEIAVVIKVNSPWAKEWGARNLLSIFGQSLLSVSADCGDDAGLHVDFAQAMIYDVADIEIAVWAELNAVRARECGYPRRASIA